MQSLWKNVNDNDRAIQCEFCNYWFHINCNNLNYIDCKFLQNSNDPWYCILCCSRIFPFNSMKSNKNYSISVSNFHNNNIKQILILAILNININFSNNNKPGKTINNEASLLLKSSENVKLLVNQFNNDASP